MPTQFTQVWYFPRAKKWYDLNLLAYEDIGVLTVLDNNTLEFRGRRCGVSITNIRRVSYGMYGRDFINHWVKVDYGDGAKPAVALFADGDAVGWSGVLGGTKRIFDVVKVLDPNATR